MVNLNQTILNLIQWNCQSLLPKKALLEHFIVREKIHIIALSETWLDQETSFRINGYNIVRSDRSDGYGGVALLIEKSIKFYTCSSTNSAIKGLDLLHVIVTNCQYLRNIIVVYCPQWVSTSKAVWDYLFSVDESKTLILGDFNGHHLNWSSKNDPRGCQIFDSIIDYNYSSLNDSSSPTRVKLLS